MTWVWLQAPDTTAKVDGPPTAAFTCSTDPLPRSSPCTGADLVPDLLLTHG